MQWLALINGDGDNDNGDSLGDDTHNGNDDIFYDGDGVCRCLG